MTTTLASIKSRAVARSSFNALPGLTADLSELIQRIGADEVSLFDRANALNAYFFATTASVVSSAAASARTVNLLAVNASTAPVGRVLKVALPSGTEVSPVDLRDTDAELAPRYLLLGTSLVEVSNDWSAISGAVTLTLTYAKRPAPLDRSGALTQTVTLPDEFADILDLRLARYLAGKDTGREGTELKGLDDAIAEREATFLTFVQQFGGVETRRFNQPVTGAKT